MTTERGPGEAPLEPPLEPHGGVLKDLLVPPQEHAGASAEAAGLDFLTLDAAAQCDLELLLGGAYSPLDGFMSRETYRSVVSEWRLPDGLAWGTPVILPVDPAQAARLDPGERLALRDREGVNLAILTVTETWPLPPDSASGDGPRARHCVSGTVQGLAWPERYGFEALYLTPSAARADHPGQRKLAAHALTPLHRFECEHAAALARRLGARLTLHPSDDAAHPDSLERRARLRAYRAAAAGLTESGHPVSLHLLPRAGRQAVARERLTGAILAQNFGFTDVVSYDAGLADTASGPRELLAAGLASLAIASHRVGPHRYDPTQSAFVARPQTDAGRDTDTDSLALPTPAEVAATLRRGASLPPWFTYPGVEAALRGAYRPPHEQGLVVFFTGLSGSGKSTIARRVLGHLLEAGERPVTLLDGDVVRLHLSRELGFSKADRDTNIRRIGYVAAEIAKHGGAAVCAPIAPYAATRAAVREMVERNGAFVEVHVATALEVCESRDRKGLYALARAGKIKEFTGVSDPYEEPAAPRLRIDTSALDAGAAAELVLEALRQDGYLRSGAGKED